MQNRLKKMTMLMGAMALTACGPMSSGGGNPGGGNDGGKTGNATPTTFQVQVKDVSMVYPDFASGVFNTPDGASQPGPVKPGHSYTFSFHAPVGTSLHFATMFVQSNDLFYAPGPMGIPLYDDMGHPVSGDVTSQVMLWDAGTEMNQEPGLGADQAPRQAGPNTGAADSNMNVRMADNTFGTLPAVSDVLQVTINPGAGGMFTVTLADVAQANTLTTSTGTHPPLLIAPGVFVATSKAHPLFTPGQPDMGMGLEALAEDGNPAMLAQSLAPETGLTVPLSPGVYAATSMGNPLFTSGQPDMGMGLKSLAEDGHPMTLAQSLASDANLTDSGAFTTPEGGAQPAPAFPGDVYTFTVKAMPGDALYLATMFVQSNDAFYAPGAGGIALFDAQGNPMSGDVTSQLMLWDAGTEMNQRPGVGADQAPRQTMAGAGMQQMMPVQPMSQVNDGFTYPDTSKVIQVTITPMM